MHETFRKKTPVQEQPANDWSAWDKWCDARIEKMMDEVYADRIGKLISAYDKKYIEALRTEIASLRADVGILRGIIKSHNVASIKASA